MAVVVDDPEYQSDTAESLKEFVSEGMILERVKIGEVKDLFGGVKCKRCEARINRHPPSKVNFNDPPLQIFKQESLGI
jgi:hypothetical protein